ncbi:transmembrane protein 222 isoform 2-T2 [Polymixia lowei]
MADVGDIDTMKNYHIAFEKIDPDISRYPYCIVWTPIPVLSWLLPFIGHMGICTSTGVIRDFAGPYFVSEDNMAFGRPTKYWMLDVGKVYASGSNAWDTAVHDASEEYKHRMHLVEHGQPLPARSHPWQACQLCRVPEDLAPFPDADRSHPYSGLDP